MTVNLNGRKFDLVETGSENSPYLLVSENLTLKTIRNQYDRDVIICTDKRFNAVGKFRESTKQQVVKL